MLTQARLKELLNYDPESGIFTWISPPKTAIRFLGKKAGAVTRKGTGKYVHISVDAVQYKAHRLAFLYMEGSFPDGHIDHIDGNGLNNRFVNLRLCTREQNRHNSPPMARNTTGHKNVTQRKPTWGFNVTIKIKGKTMNFGTYKTIEEAVEKAKQARIDLHGEFCRHE